MRNLLVQIRSIFLHSAGFSMGVANFLRVCAELINANLIQIRTN